jgi:hypothetical protein
MLSMNNNTLDETTFFTMLKQTVEKHGCKIVDVDFEKKLINLDGPDDAVASCAIAIEDLLN